MKIENFEEAQELVGEINELKNLLESISNNAINIRFTNNNSYSYLSLQPSVNSIYKQDVDIFYSSIKKNISNQILVLTNKLETL